MDVNQKLILEIGEQSTGLRGSIENLKIEFNKLGGSKELNKILKKTAEREKMLEYIEQSEKGGTLPSSRSLVPDTNNSQQFDPMLQ